MFFFLSAEALHPKPYLEDIVSNNVIRTLIGVNSNVVLIAAVTKP